MRYGYSANYSVQVRKILKDPDKSRSLVDAIQEIRSNPSQRSANFNGGSVHTDPPKKQLLPQTETI